MDKLPLYMLIGLVLAGCATGSRYQVVSPELPDQWPGQEMANQQHSDWQNWWTGFEDARLNQLVERALDRNLSLRIQIQRIEQARAELGLTNANRWPSLNGQASALREQPPETILPGGTINNLFSVAGVLSYEVDLWGRLARQREAAAAQLEQSIYGTEAIRLNLITDLVTTYFNLRAAEQQLEITRQTLESREQTLALEEIRYESGASNPLNLQRARAALESTRARLPQQELRVQQLRTALAVLAGYSPAELLGELDFGVSRLTDIRLPDRQPLVMPSELLQRRPDIRAAEAALIAAHAQLGVARAMRFPALNLSALGGYTALDAGDLFSAPAESWNLTAGLAGPIFDFGRSRARVESAEARLAQAEAEYQLVVTGAFRDARDALAVHQSADLGVAAIRRQVEATAITLELAALQYEAGSIGFYELLDVQRTLLDAELALSQAMSDRLAASATLFKAMGGGWSP